MSKTRQSILFLLNNRLTEIDFSKPESPEPTTTVLNYLRTYARLKGVKEGCAEGDCGACTVVTATASENKLVYQTVDSCLLFLPMIHGKQLLTVEHLAHDGRLHQVQQTLIDHHGSQCGYCTPGFVMSLFGIYKEPSALPIEEIKQSLTGNLCRCTGYRSILDAAKTIADFNGKPDQFSVSETNTISQLNKIMADSQPILIETADQVYLKPFLLQDALKLRNLHPDALITSGATDLALRQTKKHEKLTKILDLSAVSSLNYWLEEENTITIGAGIDLETLRKRSRPHLPALSRMLDVFGSKQIRNKATLGGNIASASPIGDTLPLLMACEAGVKVQSAVAERVIPINELFKGYRKTDLKADEIITAVIFPKPLAQQLIRAYKISKRDHMDISTLSVAFSLRLVDGLVDKLNIVYGGMAATAQKATSLESALIGKPWNEEHVKQATAGINDAFSPLSDVRGSAEFRIQAAKNLLLRFFYDTQNEGQ